MKTELPSWPIVVGVVIAVIGIIAHFAYRRLRGTNSLSGQAVGRRTVATELMYITSPTILIILFWRSAPWWVIVGIPATTLAQRLWAYRWVIWKRTRGRLRVLPVAVSEVNLPRERTSEAADLVVCHLSDIHLSCKRTLEGDLDGASTQAALSKAFDWAIAGGVDLILLTGDLTDAGEDAEWQALKRLLESHGDEIRSKILFVPGNHDLTTLRTVESRAFWSGEQFEAEENASYGFFHYLLAPAGTDWRIVTTAGNVSLSSVLTEVDEFLQVYEDNRPRMRRRKELKDALMPWRQPPRFRDLTPSYRVADELVRAARAWKGTFPWPSQEYFLMKDFVAAAYPQVLFENPAFVVIGLNSCTSGADNFLTSAFGRLGQDQLARLSLLLDTVRDKCKLIMLHHHVGLPDRIAGSVFAGIDLDVIRLSDGADLMHVLSGHDKVIIFNGHKHVGYCALTKDGIRIISGASVAYGDAATGQENCCIYRVAPSGEVHVVDAIRLTACA